MPMGDPPTRDRPKTRIDTPSMRRGSVTRRLTMYSRTCMLCYPAPSVAGPLLPLVVIRPPQRLPQRVIYEPVDPRPDCLHVGFLSGVDPHRVLVQERQQLAVYLFALLEIG